MTKKYTPPLLTILMTAILFWGTSACIFAQSTIDSKFGKGIQLITKDSSHYLKFAARFQTLFTAESAFDEDNNLGKIKTNTLIRRARLKFEGYAFTPKLSYKIELGLSNRDTGGPISEASNTANIILDAVLKWEVAKNTSLWFGQAKLPGNRERVVSSQALQFVDRSQLNSKFNIDRDVGVQLHHKWSKGNVVVREVFSISQGEGRNITAGNSGGFDYTTRIEILPLGEFAGKGDYTGGDLNREETPKLAFGLTFDYNDHAIRQNGNSKSYLSDNRNLSTIFADLMFKYKGFSLMSEYATKQAHDGPVTVLDSTGAPAEYFYTGTGFNAQAGYLFKSNWEIAGRYTLIQPNMAIRMEDINMYTLGVSKYIAGHSLKVQSDISLTKEGSNKELLYRLQVEMGF